MVFLISMELLVPQNCLYEAFVISAIQEEELKGHTDQLSVMWKRWTYIMQRKTKTLPEAQRTQGIESKTWVISPAKTNTNSVEKKIQVKRLHGSNFGHQVGLIALVTSLATRRCLLHKMQIWSLGGDTCINYKFGHQMALLALIANLATRWRYLHQLQIWPPGEIRFVFLLSMPHCLGNSMECPIGIISLYCACIFISQSHIR